MSAVGSDDAGTAAQEGEQHPQQALSIEDLLAGMAAEAEEQQAMETEEAEQQRAAKRELLEKLIADAEGVCQGLKPAGQQALRRLNALYITGKRYSAVYKLLDARLRLYVSSTRRANELAAKLREQEPFPVPTPPLEDKQVQQLLLALCNNCFPPTDRTEFDAAWKEWTAPAQQQPPPPPPPRATKQPKARGAAAREGYYFAAVRRGAERVLERERAQKRAAELAEERASKGGKKRGKKSREKQQGGKKPPAE